jgi:predicted O-linked N-acetylglucosamine transferase (SPINDLY family)
MRLAARQHATGRLREAAAIYRRVLQQDPHHAEALHALGVMAWQTGRGDAAEKLLRRAVEADPSRAAARDDLGALHFLLGQTEEAIACFSRAIELDPTYPPAHAHLGAALARLGRFEEAVAAYQHGVDAGLLGRRRRTVGIDLRPVPTPDVEPPPAVVPDVSVDVSTDVLPADPSAALRLAGVAPVDEPPVVVVSAAPEAPAADVDVIRLPDSGDSLTWTVAEPAPALVGTGPVFANAVVIPAEGEPLPLRSADDTATLPVLPPLEAVEPEPITPMAAADSTPLPEVVFTGATADVRGSFEVTAAEPTPFALAVPQPTDELPPAAAAEVPTPPVVLPAATETRPVVPSASPFPPQPGVRSTAVALAVQADGAVSYTEWDLSVSPAWATTGPAVIDTWASPEDPPVGLLALAIPDDPAVADAADEESAADDTATDVPLEAIDADALLGESSDGQTLVDSLSLSDDTVADASADEEEPVELAAPAAVTTWVPSPAVDGGVTDDEAFAVAAPHGDAVVTTTGEAVSGDLADTGSASGELTLADLESDAREDATEAAPPADLSPIYSMVDSNGDPLTTTRQLAKTIRRSRRAPSDDARRALGLYKEASALLRQRRIDEAIDTLTQLVAVHSRSAKVFRDLGCAYLRADRLDEAVAALTRAIEIRPKFGEAYASLGDAYHLQGKVDEAVSCYRRAVALRTSSEKTHSNLLLTLNYHRKLSPEALFAEHVKWAQQHARPLAREIPEHANDRSPDRPIRIGYVSPDFRRHSVNFFVEPLLARRDAAQFHVTCYSDVARPDDVTDRLTKLADAWRDIRGRSDRQVAEMVRDDGIDLLVDLAGHTGLNRLGVFARKPAPVQVTYLGYPNTTGLSTIDYRLTDNWADPMGASDAVHSEHLVRLPSFLCYQPPPEAPAISPPPSVAAGGRITFGCFNILAKVTPEVMSLWAKMMAVLPGSRLVMKDRLGTFASAARRRYVHDIFAYHRINPDRIDLLPKEPDLASHLAAYSKVDIVLDPFPYNGTTTTCEALWMGVPVITLAGNRHAARVGVSILNAAGLTEFIAATPEAYVRTAVALSRDAMRLALLRRTLRQRLSASALLDQRRFMTYLERTYREMWRWYCGVRENIDAAQPSGEDG